MVQDGVEALEPPAAKDYTTQPRRPKVEIKEYYRVGRTTDGMTTLTLMMDGGYSTTLTMNREASEQLIRMLRASYDIAEETNEQPS